MAWVYLFIAGLFEVVWATAMKQSDGFTRLGPSIVTIAAMLISFVLLALSMKALPLGTAYAVWTGIGAVGTVLIGMFFLGEPKDLPRVVSIALILAGIVGLKLTSPH